MKYIFSDLDGTLMLDSNFNSTGITIPEHNLNRINQFTSNGNVFGIATGRPYIATRNISHHNNIRDFSVCENGMIVSVDSNIIIEDNLVSEELTDLLSYCNENSIEYLGFYKDENVCFYNNKYVKESTRIRIKKYGDTYEFVNRDDIDIEKVIHLTLLFSDTTNKSDIIDSISSRYIYSKLVDTMNDAADFINNETNKLSSILKIMDIYKIDEKDVAYVGDGFNDLECLNYFTNSFVMENATEPLLNKLNNKNSIKVSSVKDAIDIFEKGK